MTPFKGLSRLRPGSYGGPTGIGHTPAVFRRRTFATLLWVLAIASLPLRVANAHLHLCLDGQDQAVSVHLQDAPTHFDGETVSDNGHNDRDVELSAARALSKYDSLDQGTVASFDAYPVALYLPRLKSVPLSYAVDAPSLETPFELRPPTRGPPA